MWRTFLFEMVKTHGSDLIKKCVSTVTSITKVTHMNNNKYDSSITTKKAKVSTFLKDDAGEFSVMRLMFVVMVLFVLGLRIWGCIIENRFIPWDWPEVSLLTAAYGSKALQTKFEGMSSMHSSEDEDIKPRSKYSSPEE
jgi:hypothetical protein